MAVGYGPNIMDTQLSPGLSDNPFMATGITPPNPPQMPDRRFLQPSGGDPALMAGLAQFAQALEAQRARRAMMPEAQPLPDNPHPMDADRAAMLGGDGGFFQNLLRKAAEAKFLRGLPTPLADRMGWSQAWGDRPVGMAQPAQPYGGLGADGRNTPRPIGMSTDLRGGRGGFGGGGNMGGDGGFNFAQRQQQGPQGMNPIDDLQRRGPSLPTMPGY